MRVLDDKLILSGRTRLVTQRATNLTISGTQLWRAAYDMYSDSQQWYLDAYVSRERELKRGILEDIEENRLTDGTGD
jgi:hypothetical protein